MSAHHALVDRALDEQAALHQAVDTEMYLRFLYNFVVDIDGVTDETEFTVEEMVGGLASSLIRATADGCYAVSSEISDLIFQSSASIPVFTLQPTDLPSPNGYVWLDGGVPLTDARDMIVVVRAFTWTTIEGSRGPAIMIGYITDASDPRDQYFSELSPMVRQLPFVSRLYMGGCRWDFGEELAVIVEDRAQWAQLVAAFFRFINEEYVAVERGTGSRQGQRRRQRAKLSTDVTLVRLRRSASPSTRSEDPQHREYDHRFVVHGHWRNQWYPSINDHRPKWIRAYVKGPEDAPLVVKREAFVVDR